MAEEPAAAMMLQGMTAHYLLRRTYEVKAGDTILVHAAAGGVGLFGLVAVFQLINLPVEFNASSRARTILVDPGIVTVAEEKMVAKVLNAAAMTYVAATIVALANVLYYAYLVFGRRN